LALSQEHFDETTSRSESLLETTISSICRVDSQTPRASPRLVDSLNATANSVASERDNRPKPFHYATFAATDLLHYHTPLFAPKSVDGISVHHSNVVTEMLRCGVDRELKVVEPILDGCVFSLGDVLLDLNNVSLHSHEHLREVLTNRALLVQKQLLLEEPDVVAWTCGAESTSARAKEVTSDQFSMEAVVMRRSDVIVLEVCT
jgi:hypothetical protein